MQKTLKLSHIGSEENQIIVMQKTLKLSHIGSEENQIIVTQSVGPSLFWTPWPSEKKKMDEPVLYNIPLAAAAAHNWKQICFCLLYIDFYPRNLKLYDLQKYGNLYILVNK